MKIGDFAGKFHVSRDTVRYYIASGLLIPDNHSAQYDFTERECRDMETILKMKQQQFSLAEIREFLSVLRISTMVEPESIQNVLDLLEQKKDYLEKQIGSLRKICDSIDEDIQTILHMETQSRKLTGVPLRALPLLVCPYCGNPLELKDASLNSRYVYGGLLHCRCGYQIAIENGIIKTGNLYTAPYDKPDLKRGLYRNVGDNFITYLQRCSDFALRELKKTDLAGKVVMEGHCNGYFFLYNHLEALSDKCVYIIQDKYPEMLEMYKRNIERLGLELDILYLADAGTCFPLRPQCVDILMDFMGDNEHSLYFKNFYISDIKKYLAPKAKVIGASMGYRTGAKSLAALRKKYPEGDWNGYCTDKWEKLYTQAGFCREAYPVGVMLESCDQYSFECHLQGEEYFFEYFRAVRKE